MKYKQSTRPSHSVRSCDVPRVLLQRHIDPSTVTPEQHDEVLNYYKQTRTRAGLLQAMVIHYAQALEYHRKKETRGRDSQHWLGCMMAKAAGEAFKPASEMFGGAA